MFSKEKITVDKIIIQGKQALNGKLHISISKNAFLPILSACILCEDEIVLQDFPRFTDVDNMINILKNFGAKVVKQENNLIINCKNLNNHEIPSTLSSVIRSSIFSLGPMLGRFRSAKVAYPGGCDIGNRPINLHIKGLECLNVKINEKFGMIHCDGSNMKGGMVYFDFPSVGATENVMMAAVLCKGTTKIINAAKEPEIVDLQNFLNKMGAHIRGAGTGVIEIIGVKKLKGTIYKPISDRIITGTYMIAAAITGGKVTLENACPEFLPSLISKLKLSSCKINVKNDIITVQSDKALKCIPHIETQPYPGFATDLQPQIMTLQCCSKGSSLIVENLFETRFKHVPELVKMGADITVNGRNAFVRGVDKLYGAEVTAYDLRGGAALVLAGLKAEGTTVVQNVHFIDRGYENIEQQLALLGAKIYREKNSS